MASTFGGISICSAGLYSSQTELYTSNVNISNAANSGYTRQVSTQKPGYTTTIENGVVVVGIQPDALSIEQERSSYLDQRYWSEQPGVGEWTAKSGSLSQMESILYDLDETGIASQVDTLDQAMENLTTMPQDSASRTEVIESTVALADTLNNSAQELYDLQISVESEVDYTVDSINQMSNEIANLNAQILTLELSGGNACALKDERNRLVDELSLLTDIKVIEKVVGKSSSGDPITSYDIQSGNSLLVSDDKSYALETTKTISDTGLINVEVTWSGNGQPYEADDGELKGHLDILNGDGEEGAYKGIPYYLNELDTFAKTLVEEMNAIHEAGYGLDGTTNQSLFDPDNTSALTICVDEDLLEHPEKLAVSSEDNAAGNANNIIKMLEHLNSSSTFNEGSYNSYMNRVTTELGNNNAYAGHQLTNANNMVQQIDLNRMSISGVSVDEETSNIVLQQQLYDATAKMMQVWSEIIETTINQLGR